MEKDLNTTTSYNELIINDSAIRENAKSYMDMFIPEANIHLESLKIDFETEVVSLAVTFPLKDNREKVKRMACFKNRNCHFWEITKDKKGNKIVTKRIFLDKNGKMQFFFRKEKISDMKKATIFFVVMNFLYICMTYKDHRPENMDLFIKLSMLEVLSGAIVGLCLDSLVSLSDLNKNLKIAATGILMFIAFLINMVCFQHLLEL